ncbi:uncharacterized protein XM38_044140 [Halomicronema hongdechloris C2206]|uniref:Uncharacterized protein n=1 Tax=Halomicronema hongdechloris C2206 TaxID=1641165 RepID=A0A1Z3HTJ7_9CYAN|nr:caspase family protein [Halomicronema hongdechloris]ASC73447.1 uncharacterized protein XM38_044140 [Halomicronema hongdechloris C2206]
MKRRQLLQSAGGLLAALGLHEANLLRQAQDYRQALAQPAGRKLALLVGINAYGSQPLQGCLTDVALQRALLIHRFGFHPDDVLTLSDRAATRDGILAAFETHLIQKAKPEDVVLFHFSGHGSRLQDPTPIDGRSFNSALVPIDSSLGGSGQPPATVSDIMGKTLFLLMSALQTEQVTVVLDSCYSGGGKRGTTVVRSAVRGGQRQLPRPSQAELAYQDSWRERLGWSRAELQQRRQAGVAKGVVITAAGPGQVALDADFGEVRAGAFTYLLTQYLWQQGDQEPLEQALATVGRSTQQYAQDVSTRLQTPEFEANLPAGQSVPMYFLPPTAPAAEAVITGRSDPEVTIWFGGVDPRSLVAFGENTVLDVLDSQGNTQGEVLVRSRQGLEGTGRWLGSGRSGPTGIFLQEVIRGIPQNLELRIGLDPSLDGMAAVQEVLAALPRIEPRPVSLGGVDYILAPLTADIAAPASQPGARTGALGLFSPGLDPLPGSFGVPGESPANAVRRLRTKLQQLLAVRLLKVMLNPSSSRLQVTATMHPVAGGLDVAANRLTVRGGRSAGNSPTEVAATTAAGRVQLPVDTEIQFEVTNQEPRHLFISLVVIAPDGELILIYPNNWAAPEDAARIPAATTLQIPQLGRDRFSLVLRPPTGVVETLVIASAVPLREALRVMGQLGTERGLRGGEPLVGDSGMVTLVDSLLSDFNQSATRGYRGLGIEPLPDIQGIDSRDVAALSIVFEVIA